MSNILEDYSPTGLSIIDYQCTNSHFFAGDIPQETLKESNENHHFSHDFFIFVQF
jgi:hypothetical protein